MPRQEKFTLLEDKGPNMYYWTSCRRFSSYSMIRNYGILLVSLLGLGFVNRLKDKDIYIYRYVRMY